MSATTAIVLGAIAVVVLGALAFITLARRSDVRGAGELSAETRHRDARARQAHATAADGDTAAEVEAAGLAARGVSKEVVKVDSDIALTPWMPPDKEALGISRRQFFNRASISLMGAGIGTFSAASMVAFLWPTKTGGFGGEVPIGRIDDVRAGIVAGSGFFYAPDARSWITEYPESALAKAQEVYQEALIPGIQQGLIATYQKCPHLGCRVPQCITSQWFECGCHGSQYNQVGEKKGGPAPRGMDHFALRISPAGDVFIDTGNEIQGQPIGVNTTGQEAEGPHCVGGGEH